MSVRTGWAFVLVASLFAACATTGSVPPEHHSPDARAVALTKLGPDGGVRSVESVEQFAIVKCRVLEDGSVRECHVIKGLEGSPQLTEGVLKQLTATKVKPFEVEGKPVAHDYVFNFRFALPKK
jgi:hypothetical protein